MGRGQPVGPALATSSDGGGIAADSIAARPVQVLVALRPGCSVTAVFQNGLDATSLTLPVPSGVFPLGHVPKVLAL
jgi:hypothetical protein